MRIYRNTLALAVFSLLASCPLLCAQQATAQYSISAWGHKDGLPSNFVYSIAQTSDGFLWLGTEDGLVRFDGVQFTPWRPDAPNGPLPGQVRALYVSHDGDLLLGTGAGLLGHMRNGRLEVTPLHAAVESIQQARDGTFWVATRTMLWHLAATLEPVEPPRALPGGWLSGPLEGRDGRKWITTREGIFSVGTAGLRHISREHAWLLVAHDGDVAWLDEDGSLHSPSGAETGTTHIALTPADAAMTAVRTDSNECLWIGTHGHGLMHISIASGKARLERFTRSDGLSSDFVRSIFEDREHNLWVATENGLNQLRRNKVLSLTRRDGLLSDTITSLAAGNDGSVWLATPNGLEHLLHGRASVYGKGTRVLSLLMGRDQQLWAGTGEGLLAWKDGYAAPTEREARFTAVTALAQDSAGALWFFDSNKGLFRKEPGHAPAAVDDPALLHRAITAMVGGPQDAVWFGLADGGLVEERHDEFHSYSVENGLSGSAVHSLSIGSDGQLWVATERGLCFLADTHFACRNRRSGLPGDRVLWALPDAQGNLWLGYNIGVAKMNAQQLRATPGSGASAQLNAQFFDDADGIANSPDRVGNAPAVLARGASLWLTTSQGVAVLDPAHLHPNLLPPPVSIVSLQADGQEIDRTGPIKLRPLTRSIQISFTGLSLTAPRKMRFRYRLDGFDTEWHDDRPARYAFYTNLPPGSYTFRVLASNNDGVWNDTGATLTFFLAPAYFQTLWFRLLCLAAAIAIAVLLFRLRLRSAKQILRLRFEERVEERTRIAQELHDHLIQEMVGISMQLEVADELTPAATNAKSPLRRALTLSRSAIASGRFTLQSLRTHPVTAAALVEALRQTADAYPEKGRTAVEYRVEGKERLLQPEIAEDLSELGQEALRNALKHAGKGTIRVHLRYEPSCFDLLICDEGSGIADAVLQSGVPGHYGLSGMRERAARLNGEFSIASAVAEGTTVHLSLPAARAYEDDRKTGNGRRSFARSQPQEKSK